MGERVLRGSRLGGLIAPDGFLVAVLRGPVPARVRAITVGLPLAVAVPVG
jgi:hypothetical protein